MLERYRDEKSRLLKTYDKILKLDGLLPVEGYTKYEKMITDVDIVSKRNQLEEEHFYVGVTGQIKSGKSTLINALVFGDTILSSDDVPHTAKITLLKYGKEAKVEVLFYNSKEWDILEQSSDFASFIKEDLDISAKRGVYKKEVVKSEALVKYDDIDSLSEYTARGGKYTPFVNTVTVYYPSEILKELTIVDTPGTDDPNELRDKVAKEWISKADANIYVVYAGQAFSQTDIEFMEKYLLSVPKNQKITVVNKIDTIEDATKLKSWVDALSKDDELRNREVFDRDSRIVFVSGLAALIDKMDKAEKELDDELDFFADKLDEKGYLDPAKYNLAELETEIGEKLIENKGANILAAHRRFIDSLFEKKLMVKKNELSIHEENLVNLGSSKSELEDKLKTIQLMVQKLHEHIGSSREAAKADVDAKILTLEQKISRLSDAPLKKINKEIDSHSNIKSLKANIAWFAKAELKNYKDKIIKLIIDTKEEILQFVNKKFDEIEGILREIDKENSIDMGSINNIVFISVEELKHDMEAVRNDFLRDNQLSNLLDEYKKLIFKDRMEEAKPKLKEYIFDMVEKINNDLMERFIDRMSKISKKEIFGTAQNRINQILHEKEKHIDKIKDSLKDKQSLIDEELNIIESLNREIKEIEDMKKISITIYRSER